MNGNCHIFFGAAVGLSLGININAISNTFSNIPNSPEMAVLFTFGGIVGGLFPDIDNPSSYTGKLTYPISKKLGKISEHFGKRYENHRGITHDAAIHLIGLVLSYLYFPSLICFFIGTLAHLYLDLFTPAGIPFAITGRRLSIRNVTNNYKQNWIFTWVSVGIVMFFAILTKLSIFL